MKKEIKEIIELLKNVRKYVNIDECNVNYSIFDTKEEVIDIIDNHIERLSNSDLTIINELNLLFLPTSDFQELSINNGWSQEYLKIASKFDDLIKKIKDNNNYY